jgi:hypothetical protein
MEKPDASVFRTFVPVNSEKNLKIFKKKLTPPKPLHAFSLFYAAHPSLPILILKSL